MHPETDPDPVWVAGLAGCPPARARWAVTRAQAEGALYRHLAREHRSEGRSSYVEIDAPLELYAVARLLRPRHVLEVGVSSGVSSAYLLRALKVNRCGRLHSIDLPRRGPARRRARRSPGSWSLPPGRASGWAVPRAVRSRWDLRLGDKRDLLPRLARELSGIELFVYDVPHDDDDAADEFRALDRILSPHGVAIVDHGPSGDLCPALAAWARRRGARPLRRAGLGLYGFRAR